MQGAGGVQAHVTATSVGGRTHIRAYWQTGVLAAAVFVPFSVLFIILIPILFESLAMFTPTGVALYSALVGALFFLARWILGRLASSHKARLAGLMDRIETVAATTKTSQPKTEDIEEQQPVEGSLQQVLEYEISRDESTVGRRSHTR